MGLAMQSPVLSQVRITGLGPGTQLSLNIDRDKAARWAWTSTRLRH